MLRPDPGDGTQQAAATGTCARLLRSPVSRRLALVGHGHTPSPAAPIRLGLSAAGGRRPWPCSLLRRGGVAACRTSHARHIRLGLPYLDGIDLVLHDVLDSGLHDMFDLGFITDCSYVPMS